MPKKVTDETLGSIDAWKKAKEETRALTQPKIPKKRLTILNVMIVTPFILGIVLVLYFFYLLFWPFNPLDIKSTSIVTPVVPAGGTLIYRINSCKNTQATPLVYKKIVSATTSESLSNSNGVLIPGCSDKKVPVIILAGTPPGQYTLYTEVVYRVNPVRDIHVYWQAGPFTVTQ